MEGWKNRKDISPIYSSCSLEKSGSWSFTIRPLPSPCVAVVVEPYPGRFTHHVLVEREEELDEELFSFLAMAWEFGENKGRGSKAPHGRK